MTGLTMHHPVTVVNIKLGFSAAIFGRRQACDGFAAGTRHAPTTGLPEMHVGLAPPQYRSGVAQKKKVLDFAKYRKLTTGRTCRSVNRDFAMSSCTIWCGVGKEMIPF
jgi:hypothetical protein